MLLVFLTPGQALSSQPRQQMVWLYWLQDRDSLIGRSTILKHCTHTPAGKVVIFWHTSFPHKKGRISFIFSHQDIKIRNTNKYQQNSWFTPLLYRPQLHDWVSGCCGPRSFHKVLQGGFYCILAARHGRALPQLAGGMGHLLLARAAFLSISTESAVASI